MICRMIPLASALALALVGAAPRAAGAEALAVCWVGGPGNTAQAAEGLRSFLGHLEKEAGLAAGSMQGEYHTTAPGCLAYIQKSKPRLVVLDLATYLQQARALKLQALAHMGGADATGYHVVVKQGAATELAALKGQPLISVVQDPRFLARVVLGGKLQPEGALKLKITERPSKALREVARGKLPAAVVDRASFERRKELNLGVELVSIFASPGLPGLTMATVAGGDKALTQKALKALPNLCAGAGAELCRLFGIKAFERAAAKTYARLEQTYQAKP